jgi:Coenzyme PQQ synthesis protein D (PqqD)
VERHAILQTFAELESKPRRSLAVSVRREGDVLYLVRSIGGWELSGVGADIWRLSDGQRSVDDIAGEIARTYEVGLADARDDVLDFVQGLVDDGLLEVGSERAGRRRADDVIDGLTLDVLREHVHVPADLECAYASGSVVAGWGHTESNLNVYFVCAAEVEPDGCLHKPIAGPEGTFEGGTIPTIDTQVSGIRLVAEYWPVARIEAMLRRCEEPVGRSLLTAHNVEFLYRLSVGVAIHGDEWLTATRERVQRSNLRSILMSRAVEAAGQSLEDTSGLLDTGDHVSALLTVQRAFRCVAEAVLVNAGHIPPTPRWRARKLREVRPKLLSFDEFWAWQTMAGFDPERPEVWIRRLAERCSALLLELDVGA